MANSFFLREITKELNDQFLSSLVNFAYEFRRSSYMALSAPRYHRRTLYSQFFQNWLFWIFSMIMCFQLFYIILRFLNTASITKINKYSLSWYERVQVVRVNYQAKTLLLLVSVFDCILLILLSITFTLINFLSAFILSLILVHVHWAFEINFSTWFERTSTCTFGSVAKGLRVVQIQTSLLRAPVMPIASHLFTHPSTILKTD